MTSRAGEWRGRVLLTLFSTVLTLGLGEAATRVVLRAMAPRGALGTPISEFSKTLGWRTRAGGSQQVRREDFDVTIALNARGLRGPEVPYDAPPPVRRLAIMGDSFAHGYYANEPETLAGRLGRALGPCRVDVLNAGVPGYSTDQEWLYFTEEISKYHPSEVVLLFYYNDLQFNVESVGTANRAKPVFLDRGGSLELAPPETKGPAQPGRDTTAQTTPTFHHSALWAFAANRLQRGRPDWSRRLAAYGLAPDLSTSPPLEYLPFGPTDAGERAQVEAMWSRTALILGRFRDDVRTRGAGFSVFYVPARFEVNDEAWTYVQRRYERDRPWRREAVRAQLASLLIRLDIPMLDVTQAFEAAERSGPPAYLPADGHWNARGNEVAFDALLPSMRRAFGCVA